MIPSFCSSSLSRPGLLLGLGLLVAACTNEPPPAGEKAATTRTVSLAAYTTPREAYARLLPLFSAEWEAKTGEKLAFEETYQASGAQARAVVGGLKADVVALSLEPDINKIVDAGLISHPWQDTAHQGIVTQSIVVIAVRPGNPKNIQDWGDLAQPGLSVLTPNVKTSGGAMWNIAAITGASLRGHTGVAAGDDAAAAQVLSGILRNVTVMDKGARESMLTFEGGTGDAAITYENEVLVAKAAGKAMDYVVPKSTILIENPIAVVDTYAKAHGNLEVSQALVSYLHSPPAQQIFAESGLRPMEPGLVPSGLPVVAEPFSIRDLGGWKVVQEKVFGSAGIYAKALELSQVPGSGGQ